MANSAGRGGLGRLGAWLVTGPPGRAVSFAIDFAAAVRTVLSRRRAGGART